MNPILIDFGPIQIYWYSVIMLFSILIASFIIIMRAKEENYGKEFISNLIFYCIIFGIIGARLYYVIFNLNYYLNKPLEIIAVWNGGLAIHGAIAGGLLCLIYHCKKYKKSILKMTDLAAPAIIIAQAVGRWGNFFNGEAHGPKTTKEILQKLHIPRFVINGMHIEGSYYHPTFLYESLWNILGFIILILLKKNLKLKKGVLTGIYFMWYSLARFFIESLRTDSLMLGNFKVAKIVSIILFIIGAYLVFYKKKDTRLNRLRERNEKNEI